MGTYQLIFSVKRLTDSLPSRADGSIILVRNFYGLWAFGVAFFWDLLPAVVLGSGRTRDSFARFLPWVTKPAGSFPAFLEPGMLKIRLVLSVSSQ